MTILPQRHLFNIIRTHDRAVEKAAGRGQSRLQSSHIVRLILLSYFNIATVLWCTPPVTPVTPYSIHCTASCKKATYCIAALGMVNDSFY